MFRFIVILLFFFSCREKSFNNACDIKSDSYLESVFVFNLLGETKSYCSTGMIDFNPSVISLNPKYGSVSEGGGSLVIGSSAAFSVQLKERPGANVSVQVVVSNPSYGTVFPTSLNFDSSNWSIPQNVIVTGVNDSILNGTRQFRLIFVPNSEDKNLDLNPNTVDVQIFDNEKRLFLSASAYRGGEFGGISGADAICASDAKCPNGSICKAMILNAVMRVASVTANIGDGQIDWVLHPNTHYYMPDGTTFVSNTNSTSLLQIPFSNVIDSVSSGVWLGSFSGWVIGANHCINWSDITVMNTGYVFRTQYTDNTLFGGNYSCSNQANLLCVEY
ncbi:DUF1554 domain-containing protein [Leptospira mtsangambouensis]|uniref:DUF1554 domain-containing protein n=1 Tax=Leptospira mtsangambouensis TaxID=2484912 RepID=A0ABY2NXV8_9LEPT|nr:DUF1554 domain-containing protein [Leptospira mtsangambouensis]TGM73390.1 DUF1554 domain-containing protein [Leptospira mtsangambouensis]